MTRTDLYRLLRRIRQRALFVMLRADLGHIGHGSVIVPPVDIWGEGRIWIGDDVRIGANCWLHALGGTGHIRIGSGTRMSGDTVISAVDRVEVGRSVLIARGVYIADHNHGRALADRPILSQGVADVAKVVIHDGAWLGHNAVVLAGAELGKGCVVAANSVVRSAVPARTVVAGAPARVVKQLPS